MFSPVNVHNKVDKNGMGCFFRLILFIQVFCGADVLRAAPISRNNIDININRDTNERIEGLETPFPFD